MTESAGKVLPVWTLATADVSLPGLALGDRMTGQRLSELRAALAALANQPVVTLEVHPIPSSLDRRFGIPLEAASPLASHLTHLIQRAPKIPSVTTPLNVRGEALYRMVVPAKVASEFGAGIVRPMRSRLEPGAIHSALRTSKGITAHASFIPVSEATAVGAGGLAGGAAVGGAAAGATALTVAAPLVLMAVAVGISAHAEHERQQALMRIEHMLEQLHEQKLDDERNELDGCRDAIDKATAILLDQGKLGVALGLDSAVHAIGKALAATDRRLNAWKEKADKYSGPGPVDIEALVEDLPGIDEVNGTFRVHLEIAALAIALKRRVIVLQAVEHAQSDPENLFENFVRALKADHRRLDKLTSEISDVLLRLSRLELTRPRGWRSPVFAPGEVERLMRSAHHIHALGDGLISDGPTTDIAVEIARESDGSVLVFPAVAA
jgi:hypothetical protein